MNAIDILSMISGSDPRIQQINQMVKESGLTPEQFFYAKAKEMGVDPESILEKLR